MAPQQPVLLVDFAVYKPPEELKIEYFATQKASRKWQVCADEQQCGFDVLPAQYAHFEQKKHLNLSSFRQFIAQQLLNAAFMESAPHLARQAHRSLLVAALPLTPAGMQRGELRVHQQGVHPLWHQPLRHLPACLDQPGAHQGAQV
jgi:hypothetical protein